MSVDAVFTQFPVLTTHRLNLRQLQLGDAEALFTIKSDFEVTKHYGQEPHQSLADSLGWIQRLHEVLCAARGYCLVCHAQRREYADRRLHALDLDPGYHHGEIGYELHPTFEKQGIMTEALSAILTFAFTDFGLHRIEPRPLPTIPLPVSCCSGWASGMKVRCANAISSATTIKISSYFGLLNDEWLKSS